MLKSLIKYYIYEITLTKLFDGLGVNVAKQIPMDFTRYCTEEICDYWKVTLESPVFFKNGLSPSMQRSVALCLHNQHRYNQFMFDGNIYSSLQGFALPTICKFFQYSNIKPFDKYDVKYCMSIKIPTREHFEDMNDMLKSDGYSTFALDILVDQMLNKLDPMDMNGLLLVFNYDSVDIYA